MTIASKNPVIAKAVEHFKGRNDAEMNSIEVPEWDTTIYYKNVSTFADQSKVMTLHQQGKVVEALVETIITKARTKDGKKMFQPAERTYLLNECDPEVLLKIATTLNSTQTQEYDVDETAKN